jgi:hypothetical protein
MFIRTLILAAAASLLCPEVSAQARVAQNQNQKQKPRVAAPAGKRPPVSSERVHIRVPTGSSPVEEMRQTLQERQADEPPIVEAVDPAAEREDRMRDFLESHPDLRRRLFLAADADSDGKLSDDELGRLRAQVERHMQIAREKQLREEEENRRLEQQIRERTMREGPAEMERGGTARATRGEPTEQRVTKQ